MNTWETVVALSIILGMMLTGCSLSPSADFITALGKDPATVSINIVYPYGTIKFCRTAILNGDVACGDNGITVKSGTGVLQIPVQFLPTLGTPTMAPAR